MTIEIKQSTTTYPLVFLMVSSSDHINGVTGLSPTVTISKAGAAFASPAGAVSEIANGWYKVAGNATDNATLGPLILHATGTAADPVDVVYNVTARLVDDLATPTNITAASGVTLAATNGLGNQTANITGNLSGSVGSVTGAVGSVTGLTASDVGAIKAKTDSLTFTTAGQVDANVLALNSDATSAANIAKTTRAIARGTASGTPTTTSIPTSSIAPAVTVADQLKGRIVTFDADTMTAALRGQATDITANTSGGVLTVTALTTAPVSGDTFSVT